MRSQIQARSTDPAAGVRRWAMLGMICFAGVLPAEAQVGLPEPGPPYIELNSLALPALLPMPAAPAQQDRIDAAVRQDRLPDALGLLLDLAAEPDDTDSRIAVQTNLGHLYQRLGEPQTAIGHYQQALDLIAAGGNGARDPRQLPVYYGIGVVEYGRGRYQPAQEALGQAFFTARSSYGLKSETQLPALRGLAETSLALGQYEQAQAHARAQLSIVQQSQGPASDDALETAEQVGDFLGRTGQYWQQRLVLRDKLKLIRARYGADDWRQVETLQALARSYRAAYEPETYGLADLELADEIARKHPERFSAVDLARLKRELGDYYMTFRSPKRANQLYGHAWALLEEAGRPELQTSWFGSAQPLFVPRPAPRDGVGELPAAGLPEGYVSFRFNVTPQGRVSVPEAEDIVPAEAADMRLRSERALREARFRPRVTASGAEFTRDVLYRMRFRYLPETPGDAGGESDS
ncbi:MAG: hypothetical protein CMN28_07780 [Salinisphaeraceae bacterium]|nr:hypothetical protein [Salinisphaeraceae bacterium]